MDQGNLSSKERKKPLAYIKESGLVVSALCGDMVVGDLELPS